MGRCSCRVEMKLFPPCVLWAPAVLVSIYLSTRTSRFIKHAQGIDTCAHHPSNRVLFIFRAKKALFNGEQVVSVCVCVCDSPVRMSRQEISALGSPELKGTLMALRTEITADVMCYGTEKLWEWETYGHYSNLDSTSTAQILVWYRHYLLTIGVKSTLQPGIAPLDRRDGLTDMWT